MLNFFMAIDVKQRVMYISSNEISFQNQLIRGGVINKFINILNSLNLMWDKLYFYTLTKKESDSVLRHNM